MTNPPLCNLCRLRPAVFVAGNLAEPGKVFMCAECSHEDDIRSAHERNLRAASINDLQAQLASVLGIPPRPGMPMVPVPLPRPQVSSVTHNNISVAGDFEGILNTGQMESVSLTLRKMRERGESDGAEALERTSAAVLASSALDRKQREDVLELLQAIADELQKEPALRKRSVGRILLDSLTTLLKGASDLKQLVDTALPLISSLIS